MRAKIKLPSNYKFDVTYVCCVIEVTIFGGSFLSHERILSRKKRPALDHLKFRLYSVCSFAISSLPTPI